ncbi:MAG: polysaccharide biosynthesis tyrosine autokinase [Oscillatoriales cyanobacterium SM2_2_1]|nr:polysaccharide biosynthesis tyrosine autokinase [Oscillatoriales cyanobacterium SM2_2_1]
MEELFRYFFILRRRKWLLMGSFVLLAALLGGPAFTAKPIYRAQGQLLFRRAGASKVTDTLSTLRDDDANLNTEAELITSVPIAEKVIVAAGLKSIMPPAALINSLDVRIVRGTSILAVGYRDIDPLRAAQVVNALLAVYIAQDIQSNRAEAQAARIFIEQQLPKVEGEVRKAEQSMRAFQESNRIFNVDGESASAIAMTKGLEQQLAMSQVELSTLETKRLRLQETLGLRGTEGIILTSPSLQQLIGELQQVEQKISLERTRYREDHPAIADLRLKRLSLQTLLREQMGSAALAQVQQRYGSLQLSAAQQSLIQDLASAEIERLSTRERIQSLGDLLILHREKNARLPLLGQQQRELERQLKAAQATYETLLAKLQEVRVAENQTTGNARVVSPAVTPVLPVSPSLFQSLLQAVTLALGGATGITLLVEVADKSLKTIEEVRSLTDYPVLGIIPVLDQTGHRLLGGTAQSPINLGTFVHHVPSSAPSDAFRMLVANLRFLNADRPRQVIMVTSSIAGEGKSTLAANLATALGQMGNRVLLIDGDMRRSRQHKIWGCSNGSGLSHILVKQSNFNAAHHLITANLHLLTAGSPPPNPALLLNSQSLEDLVRELRQRYDSIIIDAPPLTIGADALLLGNLADGTLFTLRPKVSDRSSFGFARQLLEQNHQEVLGLVINGVSVKDDAHFGYYYYVNEYYQKQAIAPNPSE